MARFGSLLHHPENASTEGRHLGRHGPPLDGWFSAPGCSNRECTATPPSWPVLCACCRRSCACGSCLLLLDSSHYALLASFFYPVGVSMYSVALVAYPSLLAPASSPVDRARKAGLIYAVAGWFGSAMGIGMGQNLGRVPVGFVVLTCALVLGPELIELVRRRGREMATTATVLFAAFCVHRAILAFPSAEHIPTRIARGRQSLHL